MLLEVENLNVEFGTGAASAPVLRGVTFAVGRGERVALVGESGCGKSMTLLALTRLPPSDGAALTGKVRFLGAPLSGPHPRISYIFQDPMASLDPVMRIGAQLREAAGRRAADAALADALRAVDLRDPGAVMRSFPCELSGGMCQRVMIAMALLRQPDLLVADEPTTALDTTTQADVMALLDRVVRERGMALLMATHNLGLVTRLCDTVNVLYAGQVVEGGPVREVVDSPRHPYTRGLLA
ncbi:MAG: ABC transporter ATP-binding protein, partial [Kiritimatiellae bacterium]|nr:ABC transporter ATP-binding protein [Kiritimatiellia bacterium]